METPKKKQVSVLVPLCILALLILMVGTVLSPDAAIPLQTLGGMTAAVMIALRLLDRGLLLSIEDACYAVLEWVDRIRDRRAEREQQISQRRLRALQRRVAGILLVLCLLPALQASPLLSGSVEVENGVYRFDLDARAGKRSPARCGWRAGGLVLRAFASRRAGVARG